jgi:predicted acetyltransferase
LLEGARDRGAAVSALYPTVAAVYRKAGWAACGELRTVDLPTGMLPRERSGAALTVRPADPYGADQPAVIDLYSTVARARDGLLTRRNPPFGPDGKWPGGIDGITLVEDGRTLVGYLAYQRGSGYRQDARLDVEDLVALTRDAAQELLAVLAGWRSVTPTVRLRPFEHDPATQLVPWEAGLTWDARPWMHRPVDVAAAVAQRGWPAERRGEVTFALRDGLAPWNAGTWRLEVGGGEARLARTSAAAAVTLDVAGFALLYCGAARPDQVREAGLLDGPVDGLDLLLPRTRAQLLDYF